MVTPVNVSPQDENNDRLRELKAKYHLTRIEIGEITRYQESTVDAWLLQPDSPNARRMPSNAIRLMELELGEVKPAWTGVRKRRSNLLRRLRNG